MGATSGLLIRHGWWTIAPCVGNSGSSRVVSYDEASTHGLHPGDRVTLVGVAANTANSVVDFKRSSLAPPDLYIGLDSVPPLMQVGPHRIILIIEGDEVIEALDSITQRGMISGMVLGSIASATTSIPIERLQKLGRTRPDNAWIVRVGSPPWYRFALFVMLPSITLVLLLAAMGLYWWLNRRSNARFVAHRS